MIRIKLKNTNTNLGAVLYAEVDGYEESKWLGDHGWYFLGKRSKADLVDKLGLPMNTRWLPANKHGVAAGIYGVEGIEWSDQADNAVRHRAQALAESRATDADIEVPRPEGLEYRPYQKAGISFAMKAFADGRNGVIFGDEMGLGKTMEAIGTARLLDAKRILVCCPASVRTNWAREFEKWWPEIGEAQVLNGEPYRDDARVVIVNYDKVVEVDSKTAADRRVKMAKLVEAVNAYREARPKATWEQIHAAVPNDYKKATGLSGAVKRFEERQGKPTVREQLSDRKYDLIIFDEAHVLKNPSSKRTKFFLGKFSKKSRRTEPGIIHNADKALVLTGTPIQNRIRESMTLLRAIGAFGPGLISRSEKGFLFRYCGPEKTAYGWRFDGASHLDELSAKLREGYMVRRLKRDVAKELPPKLRSVIHLNNPNQDLFIDRPNCLDGDDFRKAVARLIRETAGFTEISEIRAAIARTKAADSVAFVRDLLENEPKVLVFAHHETLLDAFEAEFTGRMIRIDGSTPPNKRQELVDRFQQDPEVSVAVLSTHAAGLGLTMTAARTEVFAEADWNPSWCLQAEDRAHRIGQEAEQVSIYYLVLDRTLDAHVIGTMVRKMDLADRVLDNRQEVEAPPVVTPGKPERKAAGPRNIRVKNKKGELTFLITDEIKEEAAKALRYMSNHCDGARRRDQVGFNGNDAYDPFVQSLVTQAHVKGLSDKQAAYALKVLFKYRNTQLAHVKDALYPNERNGNG